MKEKWIALLGRCDKPTDAVEDYCKYLGEALAGHGVELRLERLEWNAAGWPAALQELRQRAAAWRGQWVLVQYTALAWSARGFPVGFLRVLRELGRAGTKVGVVFHDVEPYSGQRLIDKLRRRVQVRTMRGALQLADTAVLTVPAERISWMRMSQQLAKTRFIPVGANLDVPLDQGPRATKTGRVLTVAVFGITGGASGERETCAIVGAIRQAAKSIGPMRLSVFGRHADERESSLREGLRDLPVEVSVEGVLNGQEVVERLQASDVLLFMRSGISTRRSSAIAGIACGLPVIAATGSETAPPITEAGVAFYSEESGKTAGAVLTNVLQDAEYRQTLADQSRRAFQEHFSWHAIAREYLRALLPDG
jgi:glycosyltransferase involved in cell wall biosynthesis